MIIINNFTAIIYINRIYHSDCVIWRIEGEKKKGPESGNET
jgi:hypothetical protein